MILIEGIIGVGKTTLGEILEKRLAIPLARELADDETLAILNKFYAEKKRWSFLSQINFIINRLISLSDNRLSSQQFLSDRSMFGDKIFAEILYDEGGMTKEEYLTYEKLFNYILKLIRPPELLIYLDCDVDVALARIKNRDRCFEKNISHEYLTKIHKKYKSWFKSYLNAPKLLLNTNNIDVRTSEGEVYVVNTIKTKIQECRSMADGDRNFNWVGSIIKSESSYATA